MTCPACSRIAADSAERCPSCGSEFGHNATPTLTVADDGTGPAPDDDNARRAIGAEPLFETGTLLAGRYRIVCLLGRGGMGEVYRADDLKLSQPVALKFLPAALAGNPVSLKRFVGEVRVARQITHPNVCRVYDIGEADGRTFLSMEYIDGEDLSSLLRRIGRVPQDKALEIARQMCAGMAAAHDAGVLHRDLKPANVMIDGRGRALITDFGLAGLAGRLNEIQRVEGTPAYMAPEQRSRGEVSIASDIYSLGLVLYEMFSGELAAVPPAPVTGIDRFVQRVIQRCLEEDPSARPASASEVVRMLPGGDLAAAMTAAIEAGVTPSRAMVAAAGGEGALERRTAWTLLAGVVTTVAAVLALLPWSTEFGLAPLDLSPDALRVRAQTLVRKLGYSEAPVDDVGWFERNSNFLNHRSKRVPSPEAWRTLRTAEQTHQLFRYRQSPQPLDAFNWLSLVEPDDPPWHTPGMVNVTLDSRGSLLSFMAVPPQRLDTLDVPEGATPDWLAVLAESGIDATRFRPEEPKWLSPVPFDTTAGWVGSYQQDPSTPIHVIAAALRGKPVYFEVTGPWSHVLREKQLPRSKTAKFSSIALGITILCVLGLSIIVARRNRRLRLGDSQGSLRVALFCFSAFLMRNVLLANHGSTVERVYFVLFENLGLALVLGAFVGVMYMAFEPYVRRGSPQLLIGWSRVLTGDLRDPLVGRDVLIGCMFGTAIALVQFAACAVPAWVNVPGWAAFFPLTWTLGPRARFLAPIAGWVADSVLYGLIQTAILFLALVISRRRRLGTLVGWLVIAILHLRGETLTLDVAQAAVVSALIVVVVSRYGILACTAAMFCAYILWSAPLTRDFANWYATRSSIMVGLCLALTFCGFRTSLGGKPSIAPALLDHDLK